MQSSTRILLSALLLAVAACSSAPPAVYKEEKFDSTNIYSRRFEVSSTVACEAVRRTLLSQGYVIVTSSPSQVTGSKSFQPRDDAHVQISFRVVCTDDDAKGDKSSIYVNALEDRYALKKVNNVASLGVGALGSLSLPFSSSDDSLVKVASETISSDKFYSRFFYLVERFLDNATIEDEDENHLEPPAKPAPATPAPAERPVTTMPSSATSETPVAAAPAAAAVPAATVANAPAVPAVAAGVAATPAETSTATAASSIPAPAAPDSLSAPETPAAPPVVAAASTETVASAAATAAPSQAATETAAPHAQEAPMPTTTSTPTAPSALPASPPAAASQQ